MRPAWLLLIPLSFATLAGCEPPAAPAAPSPKAEQAAAPPARADESAAKPEKTPAAPPPAAAPTSPLQDLSFDDLKFDMEKTEPFLRKMLTPKIEGYVGKPIRIRGYIRPTAFQTGITSFVLVRDNLECCFGPGAWLYDCVLVEMNPGKSTDFSVRPVAVEGVFDVQEFLGPDGKHLAIYHLQADKVE